MIEDLPVGARDEVAQLARAYGDPLRRIVELDGELFDPLTKTDRFGEVCMVVRRPNGRILTAIKTFYPRGAYRLLTGGVRHGEPILGALRRELAEETGLQAEVRRFLAIVTYLRGGRPVFHTFAFLLQETGGTLASLDPAEQLEEFREIALEELPGVADRLSALRGRDPEIEGSWRDWGRFRAVIHRVAWEALRW